MRSGSDQRPRGRFNANRPFRQQPRSPQNNQTFESNGPNVKIRGSAHQIFERYIALAREAATSGDRIAAESLYQHAEHYFRLDNARREGSQQGTPPRPTTPADVEMNASEADPRDVDMDRFQPQWDGDDSCFLGDFNSLKQIHGRRRTLTAAELGQSQRAATWAARTCAARSEGSRAGSPRAIPHSVAMPPTQPWRRAAASRAASPCGSS